MNAETKRLALNALKAKAGIAEDNYRRAKASSYGWAPAYAESTKAEWDQLKAAIAELEKEA